MSPSKSNASNIEIAAGQRKDQVRIPVTGTAKPRNLDPKARLTLEEAWKKAELQFKQDNDGKDLGSLDAGKNGVLQKWKEKYVPGDADECRRAEQMNGLLQNILNAIELVGAFAFQAASTAFPPSGMCFNALQFLIDAPRQIQKVYDGLKELLEEIEKFLIKFRIYKRIDDKFGLDEDLIINTNNLLISFVRICGLATRLLHGGKWTTFKTAFKVVLFKDDSGVPGELENFRRLATDQSMLSGTVTLEHVLQSEESISQVLADTGELTSGVSLLIAANNDEKTKFVNKDRLEKISRKLFTNGAPKEDEWIIAPDDLLPGTFDVIQATEEYQAWVDPSGSASSVLLIDGASGSGKSRLLEAIKLHLDDVRQSAERDDSSTYVAAYTFADKRLESANDGNVSHPSKKASNSSNQTGPSNMARALKTVAWQVASQSTTYAKALATDLQKRSQFRREADIEDVWSMLGLSEFKVSRSSVLFMLLDSVERQSIIDMRKLLRVITEHVKGGVQGPTIKLLITLDSSVSDIADLDPHKMFTKISTRSINEKLIVPFARKEMQLQGLFQDLDRETRRIKRQILEIITNCDGVSFVGVRAKLNAVKVGIEKGLSRDTLLQSIEDAAVSESDGQRIVRELEVTLNTADAVLLNNIIMWLMAREWKGMPLSTLEAALKISGVDLPIEPLLHKINSRFASVLFCSVDWVKIKSDVVEYLDEAQTDLRHGVGMDEALISVDISIKNATEKTVKQFFWDLNEHMVSGTFDFSQVKPKTNKISYDRLTSQLKIFHLYFKLMNEGWNDDAEPLLTYACGDFADLLSNLSQMADSIDAVDRKQIGEDLVGFLTDPYPFELRHQDYGTGSWMLSETKVNAVKFWLNDEETTRRLTLKEQRWVKTAIDPENGVLYFMHEQVRSVGKRWLTDRKCDSREMWCWIDNYLIGVEQKIGEPVTDEEKSVVDKDEDQQSEKSLDQNLQSVEEEDNDNAMSNAVTAEIQLQGSSEEQQLHGATPEEQPSAQHSMQQANRKKSDVFSTPSLDVETADIIAAITAADEETLTRKNGNGSKELSKQDRTEADQESAYNIAAVNIDVSGTIVNRAYKWVMKHLNVATGPIHLLTLGNTLLKIGNNTSDLEYQKLALEHYRRAVAAKELRPYALIGIGYANLALGKKDDAIQPAVKGLDILQQLAEDDCLDDLDMKSYLKDLKEMARLFGHDKYKSQALMWVEEVLKREPDDLANCWTVLRLRCLVDSSQDSAVELLRNWSANNDDFGGESPTFSMLDMAQQRESFEDELLSMVRVVTNETLMTLIITIATNALALAETKAEYYVQARLHYLLGIAFTCSKNINSRNEARLSWERVLAAEARDSYYNYREIEHLLIKTTTLATMLKSDDLRQILSLGSPQKMEEKKALLRELQRYVRTMVDGNLRYIRPNKGIFDVEYIIVAFSSFAGLHDDARSLSKDDMGQALEILSDSDPDNDIPGLLTLARIFCCLGDNVSLLSALSLVDRKFSLSKLDDGNPKELTFEEKSESGFYMFCDNCTKPIFSSDMDGLWWCQFCPNFDLCSTCKADYANGRQKSEMCTSDHVPYYHHLVHPKYNKEDLEPGKVKIGWEYKENEDGSYTREGGQIVEVREWVEQLRIQWGFPELSGDASRAQK